ncbi:hypothetical protein FNS94_06500 [Salmonella enterica]|nr:hypothetical protein [Salmonella enterica]
MAQEKKMKFNPRFIEAFASDQKTTSLRMMDFKCRHYEETGDYPAAYFHEEKLKYNAYVSSVDGINISLPSGTTLNYSSNLIGLLKRQPYGHGDKIELVAEHRSGETAPFATANIAEIIIIKGDQINNTLAIMDGFNPDYDPLSELFAFMRNVYPTKDPVAEMYWLYTFTSVQMLPTWGGEA